MHRAILEHKPNDAHKLIADFEPDYAVTVITQNGNDYHEQADSAKVIHFHGHALYNASTLHPTKCWAIDRNNPEIKVGSFRRDGLAEKSNKNNCVNNENQKNMLGAIIGDIVGSTREWCNIKTEDFEMVPCGSRFTDDTVMTLAVAEWLMKDPTHNEKTLIKCMQTLGRRYPNAGYGGMFCKWLVSDNPKPYRSFGNGSAMRVSPVGLYAKSLDEALELACITASVTHNHPEGIKGAQAIAACIFLQMENKPGWKIKEYIEQKFGYNLNVKLEDIRDEYSFDVTCQGSVPIAIMAFLQRNNAEGALRLAISMGGDSDTIGCMTSAIAKACSFHVVSSTTYMPKEVIEQCRALLPPELLDINDRFEAFITRPLYQSYMITGHGIIFAGEYPGDKDDEVAKQKINQMLHFGIKHFIDLTEEHELYPYSQWLPEEVTYIRFPIRDCGTPKSISEVHKLLQRIEELKKQDGYTYIHCWGGVGRTGTIIACMLAEWREKAGIEDVLNCLRDCFSQMPKSTHRQTPETKEQIDFIKRFTESCPAYKKEQQSRILDCIRGCLMAGAAGDALGYPLEFMSRGTIISRYGKNGITQFELDSKGQALVSDDTQMTLFTANGMLMGLTRGYMRGIGGAPEKYVNGAYLDWYYTQTKRKKETFFNDFHYTWLRDLPELAHRRAPGNTCISACESLLEGKGVNNNSKGCGGIMRVAPMALLEAGYTGRNEIGGYSDIELAEAGAEIAQVTHKHPLGFLPAAMLTHLLSRLVPLSVEDVKSRVNEIIDEAIILLGKIYMGEFEADKEVLSNLTRKAMELAHSDIPDEKAICQLGEGWTGEETWAIALYCSVRHIDSVADAIIASVNHDGDSDSTGSVTGNIMGAIYGYEYIKQQNLFCPTNQKFEEILELSNIILALADDVATGCIISEYDPIETPEKKQWYERYCEMRPAGIDEK